MDTDLKRLRIKLGKKLEHIENDLSSIKTVEGSMRYSVEDIKRDIEKRADLLKKCIDEVVREVTKVIDNAAEKNDQVFQKVISELTEKLNKCKENVAQCEKTLTPSAVDGTEPLVSHRKVAKMVYDSIDQSTYVQPNVKVLTCKHVCEIGLDVYEYMKRLVGYIETSKERIAVSEERNESYTEKLKLLTVVNTRESDINALATADGSSIITCFNSGAELVRVEVKDLREDIVPVSFEVDDIAVAPSGDIYATSPDGHCVKHVSLVGTKARISDWYQSDVFIHGLTLSNDKSAILACATDSQNYSDTQPTKTSIIQCSLKDKTVVQIDIQGYAGKVYRIAQNIDGQYIMTFPKEGRLLAVNNRGHVVSLYVQGNNDSVCQQSRDFHHVQTSKRNARGDSSNVWSTSFWPSGVCCDVNGCIYVSDWLGKKVHVLDRKCKLLGHVLSGYQSPNGLAVSGNGRTIVIGDHGRILVLSVDFTQAT